MNYVYKKNINANIFRGYDIRGVYPSELDEDSAYTIVVGVGSYIKKIVMHNSIVGQDNRVF